MDIFFLNWKEIECNRIDTPVDLIDETYLYAFDDLYVTFD
jgi:hypothetical protein